MNNPTTPQHYRPAQIILHWIVALGVITQMIISESMVRVYRTLSSGETAASMDTILAWIHAGVGSTILVAVLARLYMRYRHGKPDHAPGTPPMQAKIADFVHGTLYALLIAMALTGMMTWNGIAALGDIHFYLNVALFFLILAHAGAAIYNQFVRKDGTLKRMSLSRSNKP